jgi:hypothetical protein
MRQEIIKIHREALQYIDEYLAGHIEGKVTNKTVRVYMDSEISDLPVMEQIQRVINVLEEQIEKPKMTYKEELQAEKLKLEEEVARLEKFMVQLDTQIEFMKRSRIIRGKEPISERMIVLTEKTNLELAGFNQEIQRLKAKINIL